MAKTNCVGVKCPPNKELKNLKAVASKRKKTEAQWFGNCYFFVNYSPL